MANTEGFTEVVLETSDRNMRRNKRWGLKERELAGEKSAIEPNDFSREK